MQIIARFPMTQSPTFKLDTPVYEILIRQGLNDFTVMRLRDAISAPPRTTGLDDRIGIRRKTYRHILRLIELGLIEKRKEGGKFSTYEVRAYSSVGDFCNQPITLSPQDKTAR